MTHNASIGNEASMEMLTRWSGRIGLGVSGSVETVSAGVRRELSLGCSADIFIGYSTLRNTFQQKLSRGYNFALISNLQLHVQCGIL